MANRMHQIFAVKLNAWCDFQERDHQNTMNHLQEMGDNQALLPDLYLPTGCYFDVWTNHLELCLVWDFRLFKETLQAFQDKGWGIYLEPKRDPESTSLKCVLNHPQVAFTVNLSMRAFTANELIWYQVVEQKCVVVELGETEEVQVIKKKIYDVICPDAAVEMKIQQKEALPF